MTRQSIKRSKPRGLAILLFALSVAPCSIAIGQTTAFFYHSGVNGSYIAGGARNVLIEPGPSWEFDAPVRSDDSVEIRVTNPDAAPFGTWKIDFAPVDGFSLEEGSYLAREFGANPDYAGEFSWSGFGRQVRSLAAQLRILEITFNPDDSIASLAIDFVQWESTASLDVAALTATLTQNCFGSYRFNSSIPINKRYSPPFIRIIAPRKSKLGRKAQFRAETNPDMTKVKWFVGRRTDIDTTLLQGIAESKTFKAQTVHRKSRRIRVKAIAYIGSKPVARARKTFKSKSDFR